MARRETNLASLYADFVAKRSEESQVSCKAYDRRNAKLINRLAARGVTTVRELIEVLPDLSPKLQGFAIWWISVTNARGAESALWQLLHADPASRVPCAGALAFVGGKRSTREFIRIGQNQLALTIPNRKWLDAVIQGLKFSDHPDVGRLLLTIFERSDLPGWLRGDAGDAMGCCSQMRDRRTSFFRRARTAALIGLSDADIEVQFWSMYVIMTLAQNFYSNPNRSNHCFNPALPRLRAIAADDHRPSPGLWWPMSAEAEDTICVIQTGRLPENDAGDRWHGSGLRGPSNRD